MSYVIQNFYESNKKITLTPRFKYFFFLIHINKLIFFIKFNNLLALMNYLNFSINPIFVLFVKYFFSKMHVKILNNLNLSTVSFYSNNLIKSYIYSIFSKINNSLKFKFNKTNKNYLPVKQETIPFYFYCFSIKTIKFQINNNFFKNIFFFCMLQTAFLWNTYSSNIKFYLNFILSNNNLKLNRFYSSYFLKIYNY